MSASSKRSSTIGAGGGRPNQRAPKGDWRTWLLLAGRGFGNTRSGAECIRDQVIHHRRRIALVAPTAADARDVMVEGESGLLGIGPPQQRPRYEPTKRSLPWSCCTPLPAIYRGRKAPCRKGLTLLKADLRSLKFGAPLYRGN